LITNQNLRGTVIIEVIFKKLEYKCKNIISIAHRHYRKVKFDTYTVLSHLLRWLRTNWLLQSLPFRLRIHRTIILPSVVVVLESSGCYC